MTKLKIALVAATAGLAIPAISSTAAQAAEPMRASAFTVNDPDPNDLARTQNGRLRKTDEEFTQEQSVVEFFAGGKRAIYVEMRTGALPSGEKPVHNMQGACTPVELVQSVDGSVTFQKIPGKERFISDNNGNEYRNFNKPGLVPINGGKNLLVTFNYQPNGTNDTRRYAKVLDQDCNLVPVKNGNGQTVKQVQIMAKNNDDCDMQQSMPAAGGEVHRSSPGKDEIVLWAGCNGNGRDDGWLNHITVTCDSGADGAATGCTITKDFDLSLAQREERSRGACTTSDADPDTATCCWTEGNTQPQRDGVWCAGVDIAAGGQQGANAQSRLLWKKQIAHRMDVPAGQQGQGKRAYAMRMNSMRVMLPKADGSLEQTDMLMIYFHYNVGRNNNNKKGGYSIRTDMGVAKVGKTGLEWVTPLTDVSTLFLGTDHTHTTLQPVVYGEGANLMPGVAVINGSQIGGGISTATLKAIAWNPTTKQFLDLGIHDTAAYYDRHLYPNYLGNNPGNQGRNFSGSVMIKNPYAGMNGNKAQYLLVNALTGKDPKYVGNAAMKGSSYLSIVEVAHVAAAAPPPASAPPASTPPPSAPPTGPSSGNPNSSTPPPAAPQTPSEPAEQPESPSMMGCSAAPGSGGAGSALVLVAGVLGLCIIRRRRA